MLCSGDMFKLYYRLVFVESSRLSWSTKVLTEAKNLGTFHIFKNSAILRKCCYGFKLSSPVSPREPMTCADVIQLCPFCQKGNPGGTAGYDFCLCWLNTGRKFRIGIAKASFRISNHPGIY